MLHSNEQVHLACAEIVELINRKKDESDHPLIAAIDGESGSGKSTIASIVARNVDGVIIPLDDFFAGHIPSDEWTEFTAQERLDAVFDWSRIRKEVLEPLKRGSRARWYAFDFQAGLRPDGTYGMEKAPKVRDPADVVLLEGAYSSNPRLSDLVDIAILVDVPREVRHARLRQREDPAFLEGWHGVWDDVEEHYRRNVRPRDTYDLVVGFI